MSEELKSKAVKKYNIKNNSNYKHHKVDRFTCEAEVEQDGKTICCLHDPIKGDWKWPVKGSN